MSSAEVHYGQGFAGYSDEQLVEALEQNLWGMWSEFGRGSESHLYNSDGALWFDSPIADRLYNGVLRFAVEEDVDRRIDALLDHYRARSVPFCWLVHPTAQPPNLAELLETRGLQRLEERAGMAMSLDDLADPPPVPEGIEIREASMADADRVGGVVDFLNVAPGHEEQIASLTRRFRIGSGDSKVRCWLAWRGEEVIAQAVLHPAVGSAALYSVSSSPEVREIDLDRALALTALAAARQSEFQLGVVYCMLEAISLYAALGFRAVVPFSIYG